MLQYSLHSVNRFDELSQHTFARLHNGATCLVQLALTLGSCDLLVRATDEQIMLWGAKQIHELNSRILYAKRTTSLQCQKHCTVW